MPSTTTSRLEGVTTSVAVKAPCRAGTTANITLSGLQTVDGIALASGDRVLVKNQTTASENGIYTADTGAWTRAPDFDGSLDVVKGTLILVHSGTTASIWRVASADPITIGTSSISFEDALGFGESRYIDVRALGAVGDGATDDSAAFTAAFQILAASRTTTPYSDALSQIEIFVPAGKYVIDTAEALLPSTYTTKTQGFIMRGAGTGQTQIIFTADSGVLLYNEAFLNCLIEDITFVGTTREQTFYRSNEAGNAQARWLFNRVNWIGTWGKGFHLTGANNNSEYSWTSCAGTGEMGDFLYVPSTLGSDQHLLYNMTQCWWWFWTDSTGTAGTFTGSIASGVLTVASGVTGTLAVGQTIATPAVGNLFSDRITGQEDRVVIVELLTGAGGTGTYRVAGSSGSVASTTLANLTNDTNCLVNMAKGGHVHLSMCDFSGWNCGTLFKLRGVTHAYGVCSFTARDCRAELKTPRCAVMFCEWPQGMVTFGNFDFSSQTNNYLSGTTIPNAFWMSYGSQQGPSYQFTACQLIGQFVISHGTSDVQHAKSFSMKGCHFMQHWDPYAAFTFVSSSNDDGHPDIKLEDCHAGLAFVNLQTAWAADTAVTLGATRRSNNSRSVYEVTTAGTTGKAASAFTGSISTTTLTVASVGSGTLSVGQTIDGVRNATVDADTNSTTTVTINSVSSGQLAVGQAVSGSGIPSGATIASIGTFNGTSGTVVISAAATATAAGVTLTAYGRTIAADTVITALGTGTGGTGTYTVSRSQTAFSQSTMIGTGGPQSASSSIPDGTAVWKFKYNASRDYLNDGLAMPTNVIYPVQRPKMERRVAVFGAYGLKNEAGSLGTVELVIPPNAVITGGGIRAPSSSSGGSSSANPADYQIECDDGTVIVGGRVAAASTGFSFRETDKFIQVRSDMQKRRIKLIAGGYGGGTVDQFNSAMLAYVEYLI